jgi:hypothetical protein
MLNRRSLDPEQRTLYGANLQPPAGYVFDAAIATTFSLDFETALAVPVSLALFAAENRDEILTHPLALLEGAERIAGRLLVFTDAGHIQAHTRPHSRLCSLLERIIVEVAAPNNGAFHPKMWALRFKPVRADEPARLRLLVLSRNLTRDRSWDIALTLDGVVAKRPQALNRPLVDFIRRLGTQRSRLAPGNATQPALLSGSNVELFATLTGKRSRVGSVEEILGEKGFGRLTRPFLSDELAVADSVRRAAEARLDAARRELCRSGLKLRCEREPSADDGQVLWRVWLVPLAALSLTGIGALRVWPITRGEGHAHDALEGLQFGQAVDLGAMPLLAVSRLSCDRSG